MIACGKIERARPDAIGITVGHGIAGPAPSVVSAIGEDRSTGGEVVVGHVHLEGHGVEARTIIGLGRTVVVDGIAVRTTRRE